MTINCRVRDLGAFRYRCDSEVLIAALQREADERIGQFLARALDARVYLGHGSALNSEGLSRSLSYEFFMIPFGIVRFNTEEGVRDKPGRFYHQSMDMKSGSVFIYNNGETQPAG